MPVAITYCPLCNSAVAFDRRVAGQTLRFGVSGLLRNSDLVMWDDATESLWQQLTGEAIVGSLTGTQLDLLPAPIISWSDFKQGFPDGQVLSRDTGYERAYGSNPYEGYDASASPFLFRGELDARYPAMERVVGMVIGNEAKGYPFTVLKRQPAINDELADTPIVVFWGAEDTASALDSPQIAEGRAVGVGVAYNRVVSGRELTFESVGDSMFRDTQTKSLWDLLGEAIEGPLKGASLTPLVHTNHLWFAWAAFYPDAPLSSGR